MAILISILSIVVLAIAFHLVLYFVFKIDAKQLLMAATIASLIIVVLMMQLYRNYTLAPTTIILLLVALAVVSALLITFGEQYFSLFPKKREPKEPPSAVVAAAPPAAGLAQVGLVKEAEETRESEAEPEEVPAVTAEVSEAPAVEAPPQEAPVEEAPAEVAKAGPAPAEEQQVPEAPPATGKTEEEIAALINEGYEKINRGEYQAALESLQLAIVFVDEPSILVGMRKELAQLWFLLGERNMATIELHEALRLAERSGDKEAEVEIRSMIERLTE